MAILVRLAMQCVRSCRQSAHSAATGRTSPECDSRDVSGATGTLVNVAMSFPSSPTRRPGASRSVLFTRIRQVIAMMVSVLAVLVDMPLALSEMGEDHHWTIVESLLRVSLRFCLVQGGSVFTDCSCRYLRRPRVESSMPRLVVGRASGLQDQGQACTE